MIWNLFKRKKANQALVERQYAELTGAARSEVFYETMGVPDTVMGRFEMISLHLFLYLRRTGSAGEAAKGLAQECFNVVATSMLWPKRSSATSIPNAVRMHRQCSLLPIGPLLRRARLKRFRMTPWLPAAWNSGQPTRRRCDECSG